MHSPATTIQSRTTVCNIAKMQILANLAYYIPTKQVEKYFRNIRSLLKGASK